MSTPLYKIAILNKSSLGANYLYFAILYYFSINNISFPQIHKNLFNPLNPDINFADLYQANTLVKLTTRFPIKFKYFNKEINSFFNYKLMVKKCFFEQALSYAYKYEANDPTNNFFIFDKFRSDGTQRKKINSETCVISIKNFTDILNRFVESHNLIYNNFSNLTFINYEDIKYDMDHLLKKIFNLDISAKDKFDLGFTEISKIAFLNPKSEQLEKFRAYSKELSDPNFRFPIQKIKLEDKINLIQNFDELLYEYQTVSRNSNLLNYVTEKDIQNRIENENKHYSD